MLDKRSLFSVRCNAHFSPLKQSSNSKGLGRLPCWKTSGCGSSGHKSVVTAKLNYVSKGEICLFCLAWRKWCVLSTFILIWLGRRAQSFALEDQSAGLKPVASLWSYLSRQLISRLGKKRWAGAIVLTLPPVEEKAPCIWVRTWFCRCNRKW